MSEGRRSKVVLHAQVPFRVQQTLETDLFILCGFALPKRQLTGDAI
jgi:hypothetical protein